CSRKDSILRAAENGMGALTFAFIDPEEARAWIHDYERALGKCQPVGLAVNPKVACVTPMMCHADEGEAIARGIEGGNFFGYSLAHYYVFGDHQPGRTDVWREFQEKRSAMGYSPQVEEALQQDRLGARVAAGDTKGLRGAIGTPAQLREYLRRYEEVGVDQLIFVMQCGRNRHEHILESLELFAREVLPEFEERDEAAREAKASRLAPLVEAALARREDRSPPMPADYTIPAMPKKSLLESGRADVLERVARETAIGQRTVEQLSSADSRPTRKRGDD
ncbi:MAG TPA: hypothetical protein VLC53_07020, partial [Myxococcota bacterium]|nr:hypothetical protein [Myxococcota bacterium]